MSLWFMTLIISGAIFTHKEVTATGEIVIHNHPYDFTKKGKKHHHTEDEIHFLDVVFHHVYTQTDFIVFEPVIRPVVYFEFSSPYFSSDYSVEKTTIHLRGPPLFS